MASAKAFCKPSASVAPRTVLSKNRASALPSKARLRPATADASAPRAWSFFSNAGVAAPVASRPTATGMSFCETALSAAWALTPLTCTAKRRGEAKSVTAASAPARPWAFRLSASTLAKASPSFFRALGGSSSTNNSTSRFWVVMFGFPAFMPLRLFGAFAQSIRAAPWGSPGARGSRNSTGPRRVTGCGCDPCRRRARSR